MRWFDGGSAGVLRTGFCRDSFPLDDAVFSCKNSVHSGLHLHSVFPCKYSVRNGLHLLLHIVLGLGHDSFSRGDAGSCECSVRRGFHPPCAFSGG